MSKYAMYRRRGSTPPGESAAPSLPPVPLVVVAGDTLDWSAFAGPDPVSWLVFQDANLFDTVAPPSNTDGPVPSGHGYTVLGVDGSNVPVTQLSNSVSI